MTKFRMIRGTGWLGLALSVLLAVATLWSYSTYRVALGNLSGSLASVVSSAADTVRSLADTAKARGEVAEDTVKLLQSSRTLVLDLRASAERQRKLLPQYADSMKGAAISMSAFSASVTKTANALSVEVPLLKSKPFGHQAQALKDFAERGNALATSLDSLATSLNTDATRTTDSFIVASKQTLKLIDEVEKMATAVKAEHLPRSIVAMEEAATTLKQASGQIQQVNGLGLALLAVGLLLAGCCGTLSIGLLNVAGALDSEIKRD